MVMGRRCEVCGKHPSRGYTIARRGLAKKKGGVGRKITGRTKRSFNPNIQNIRVLLHGKVVRMKVCTSCITAGKVAKPA